jgi:hypothetical protein
MLEGVSQCIPAMNVLHFGSLSPFHYSLLPPPSHPCFHLSVHILISSTFTDVMFYDIVDALVFSFPFPPSQSSIEQFRYYKFVHV